MNDTIENPKGIFKEFIYLFELHKKEAPSHPWDCPYRLTDDEREAVIQSIRQFQLGEGSDGKEFLERAKKFSEKIGDSSYEAAVKLFIKEEQRHSSMLARCLKHENAPLLKHHWTDWCFRRLRHLADAQNAATVLVTAELIARPYYRALRGATRSPLLKSVCQQILQEEDVHIHFQATALALMEFHRPPSFRKVSQSLHRAFMHCTCLVAWRSHRSVFANGNYTFEEFRNECLKGLEEFYSIVEKKRGELEVQLSNCEHLPIAIGNLLGGVHE